MCVTDISAVYLFSGEPHGTKCCHGPAAGDGGSRLPIPGASGPTGRETVSPRGRGAGLPSNAHINSLLSWRAVFVVHLTVHAVGLVLLAMSRR